MSTENSSDKVFAIKVKGISCTPRKLGLVVSLAKNKKLEDAAEMMRFVNKKAAIPVRKAILSLINQIDSAFENDPSKLDQYFIESATVGRGLCLKRIFRRAKGRHDIKKYVSSTLRLTTAERSG